MECQHNGAMVSQAVGFLEWVQGNNDGTTTRCSMQPRNDNIDCSIENIWCSLALNLELPLCIHKQLCSAPLPVQEYHPAKTLIAVLLVMFFPLYNWLSNCFWW
ncbi:hypothetical protein VNO77_22058 [Canavalia gladiata]|uniref:Uncharacterized protein n=1 Tax=Canavalia gladiata TaxID=3824 RepID=A0AAN9QAP3_CANGL